MKLHQTKIILSILLGMFFLYQKSVAQVVSRSFELRYFIDSTLAEGTIGFNGDATIFTPEERLAYLDQYAEYAKVFFQDKDLDKEAVESKEVIRLMDQLKDAPKPSNRQRLVLKDWRWKTYENEERKKEEKELQKWTQNPNVEIVDNALQAVGDFSYSKDLEEAQDWRFVLQWETKIPQTTERSAFLLLDKESNPVILLGITAEGNCFYKSRLGLPIGIANYEIDTVLNFKLLVDVEANRFSLFINDEIKADFVRTLSDRNIHKFFVKIPVGASLDNIYGISYERPNINPFEDNFPVAKGRIFMDEDFELSEELGDLTLSTFRDEDWQQLQLPIQSGDRYRNTDLILRKPLLIGNFEEAKLHCEQISPNTEVWLNNNIIHIHRLGDYLDLDITNDLLPNQPNKLMLRMRGEDGWQLQKVYVDLMSPTRIKQAFVAVEEEEGDLNLNLRTILQANQLSGTINGNWQGRMNVKITPWLPKESSNPVVNTTFPVSLRAYKGDSFYESISLAGIKKWSPEQPNLYKISLSLLDSKGQFVDEYVLTTGFRKIDQKDGIFHLNDRPIALFGANLTDYLPFDIETYTIPSLDMDAWLVKAVASIKAMNGNVVRISNLAQLDLVRLLEICDQMGLLLIYESDAVPNKEPWAFDWLNLKKRLARFHHHPSLIIWQAPDEIQFTDYLKDAVPWMADFYNSIQAYDADALIAPTGAKTRLGGSVIPNDAGNRLYESGLRRYRLLNDSSIWIDSLVVRSGAAYALSFGKNWDDLQDFPIDYSMDTLRQNYLNSSRHAYLDVGGESLAGQDNPLAVRGIPYRYSESYESPYTFAAIGDSIAFEEWQRSQTWQAFAHYESLRKKRWLGFDGILAAKLWNGSDPTTLLDAKGHAKLAFYTSSMAFQSALAGSKTTDLAYAVGEEIPVFLNYTGRATRLSVTIRVKNQNGKLLETQNFPTISFPTGSSTAEVGTWVNSLEGTGWFFVEYEVMER
ncbi:MAG: hypothetical protein AAF849_01415 [Bacteroidota bacterium]